MSVRKKLLLTFFIVCVLFTIETAVFAQSHDPYTDEMTQAMKARESILQQVKDDLDRLTTSGKDAGAIASRASLAYEYALLESQMQSAKSLSELGQLIDSGLDINALTALFQNIAQEMRETAREQRDSEMSAQVAALKASADDIRKAADERFIGAIVSGALAINTNPAQAGMGITSHRVGINTTVIGSGSQQERDPIVAKLDDLQEMFDIIRSIREQLNSINYVIR